MKHTLSMAAATALLLGTAGAADAEFPTFEINGLPITAHQLIAVQTGQVRERSPTSTLTLGSMPASPHQIAVLTPRPRLSEQEIADKLMNAGFSQVQFVAPPRFTVMGLRDGGWIMLSVDSRTGEPR